MTRPQHARAASPIAKRSTDLPPPLARKAGWTDLDVRAVDTARLLAADAVQKVGNGHPGTAMSLAPVAYLLYQQVMTHDPSDPTWLGRDRFVLSCGHSSADAVRRALPLRLRPRARRPAVAAHVGQPHPRAPRGAPHQGRGDHHRPAGLGPRLGRRHGHRASVASAGCSTPTPSPGPAPSTTTSTCSPPTATSWRASRTRPRRWPATRSSATSRSSTTRTTSPSRTTPTSRSPRTSPPATRPTAGTCASSTGARTPPTTRAATPTSRTSTPCSPRSRPARRCTDKPTLVAAQDDHRLARADQAEHRQVARLGPRRRRDRRDQGAARLPPGKAFAVERAVLAHARQVVERGKAAHKEWDKGYKAWRKANPDRAALLDRLGQGRAARPGWPRPCRPSPPTPRRAWPPGPRPARCSRARRRHARAVGRLGRPRRVQQHDDGAASPPSSRPASRPRSGRAGPTAAPCTSASASSGWACILNGIALEGLTRPYGGTFLVFSDYMRGAVRLAAIRASRSPTCGPTTPSASARTAPPTSRSSTSPPCAPCPGLDVVRPADANETAVGLGHDPREGPPGRPGPHPAEPADHGTARRTPRRRGASGRLRARRRRTPTASRRPTSSSSPPAPRCSSPSRRAGRSRRPASARGSSRCRAASGSRSRPRPTARRCCPRAVRARVSIEAAVDLGWHDVVGDAGRIIGLEHFGASADARPSTASSASRPSATVKAAKDSIKAARAAARRPRSTRPTRGSPPNGSLTDTTPQQERGDQPGGARHPAR